MADGGRKAGRDPRGPKHDATAGTTNEVDAEEDREREREERDGGREHRRSEVGLRDGAKLRPPESVSASTASAAAPFLCSRRSRPPLYVFQAGRVPREAVVLISGKALVHQTTVPSSIIETGREREGDILILSQKKHGWKREL